MTQGHHLRDLIVLVADKDMEQTLKGLLPRHQALRTRRFDFEIYTHPGHDGGCRTQGINFLRNFCRQFEYACLIFDREGSGGEHHSAEALETELETRLGENGWENRAAAIVIDPELEIWIWTHSPEAERVMGWVGRNPNLREWLIDKAYLSSSAIKPSRPKEAFRAALRHSQKPPSAALFRQIAERTRFQRCTDRAFLKLVNQLSAWFPSTPLA